MGGKESVVEINGHLYRYEYRDGKTHYLGPVGSAPSISEEEFMASFEEEEERYEVIVGNIGTVYDGDDLSEAERVYEEYVGQSKGGYGRAADEDVTLMGDGEPIQEYDAPEPDVVAENIESWVNGNRTHVRGEVKKMRNDKVAQFVFKLYEDMGKKEVEGFLIDFANPDDYVELEELTESWVVGNKSQVLDEMSSASPEEVAAFTYYLQWMTEFSSPGEGSRFVRLLEGRIED
jgi:hypothetical protein